MIHRVAATLALVLAQAGPALACSVCYGSADGPIIRGLKLSVFLLMGVTYVVIGGLVAGFIILRRRARKLSHQGAYGHA